MRGVLVPGRQLREVGFQFGEQRFVLRLGLQLVDHFVFKGIVLGEEVMHPRGQLAEQADLFLHAVHSFGRHGFIADDDRRHVQERARSF